MKILFVDFDGVLNSDRYFEGNEYVEYRKSVNEGSETYNHSFHLDPSAIELLNGLMNDIYDLRIVISSTWKRYGRLDECKSYLGERGFTHVGKIIGATPDLSDVMRGQEIREWCIAHIGEFENYCIVDDNDDMLPEQLPYFVQTDSRVGLTVKDIEKIKQILKIK
jgi:hypothetical protein